jgi:hypothetical protein
MAYTSSLSPAVEKSTVQGLRASSSLSRPYGKLDVGYLVFGFGVIWVLAIAAALAVPTRSLPDCQLTVLGDVAGCEAPDRSPRGLNIAEIPVRTGILSVAYDTY